MSPADPSTLYAVAQGFYVSHDTGLSWERSLSAPPYMNGDLVQDPFDSATMYVATTCCFGSARRVPEVWVTTDAGVRWTLRNSGLPQGGDSEPIHNLVAHPREPGVLLASLSTGVYRTENQGRDWTRLAETDVGRLAGFDSESSLVWAVKNDLVESAVGRSLDGGRSWAFVLRDSHHDDPAPGTGGEWYFPALVPDPLRSNGAYSQVYVSYGAQLISPVWQTLDAGDSWTMTAGLPSPWPEPVESAQGLSSSPDGILWVSRCGINDVYALESRDTREIDPR